MTEETRKRELFESSRTCKTYWIGTPKSLIGEYTDWTQRAAYHAFLNGLELGEKAGRSAQAVIDAKIAAEADTNYDAEEQILAGFRQHQEGQ